MLDSNLQFPSHSISGQVYKTLKKEILDGSLPPGIRLLVLEIAGRFGISQAPVREALERLKQEGLIVGQRNKGSVVSNITSKEIRDIFVLREIVEGYAVRVTMPQMLEADYTYLNDILKRMGEAVQNNDVLMILEQDMQFHGFFYQRCGNNAILELWNQMQTKVMRFMAISNRYHTTDKLVEVHQALLDVLRTGDTVKAEEEFIYHMKAYKIIHLNDADSSRKMNLS